MNVTKLAARAVAPGGIVSEPVSRGHLAAIEAQVDTIVPALLRRESRSDLRISAIREVPRAGLLCDRRVALTRMSTGQG